ncbi:hypothetical protein [Tunicatimonas pelagia]|uniref:hypothetical protein n=1 Tax=Tunicatimonas pelagia TaxID=931531 RepID=UPI0026666422|nr:hypothetical protein [Tunicatimonas pelagia]WKN42749.1 hypothetical protein P0M28_27305 [Tunicatimonas pelagia]
MSNNDQEKWVEAVFQSMKGSRRATPSPELFSKIQSQIEDSKSKVVPLYPWRYVAAAVAVLFVNATALIYYNQPEEVSSDSMVVAEDGYGQPLISSYQIYE